MYNKRIPTIKHWAEQERPREKFLQEKGINISNAELIAILIGSGNSDESAVSLAHRILYSIDDDLEKLAELSIQDLSRFKGIGFAKAVSIAAAVELCHRRMGNSAKQYKVGNSSESNNMIKEVLCEEEAESYWVFVFSSTGILKHRQKVGDRLAGFGDPRTILQIALEHESTAMMLVHYAAAEYLCATKQDLVYTLSLIESSNMLSIAVLDHIVTYADGYYSFRDNGLLTYLT